MKKGLLLVMVLVLALSLEAFAFQNEPDGFRDGWFLAGSHPQDYSMGLDRIVTHSGKASGYLKSRVSEPRGFGTLMQMFKADDYRDKRICMSGYVKAEKLENWAGLWMRVDGPEYMSLGFDNMQNRPIKGTIDWIRYEIVLDVPQNSINIALGILLSGEGQVWVDDLQFDVVGKDMPTTDLLLERTEEFPKQPLNLDFE